MQKSSLMPRIRENNIMVGLRDRVDDVPESLVEQAETSLLQDFFGQLQQAGHDLRRLSGQPEHHARSVQRPT